MKKSESLRQLALGDRKLSWLGSFADEMQRLEEENERLMRDVEKFTGVGQMYESEITRLENAIGRQNSSGTRWREPESRM